jgi:ribonuclease HII
MITGHKGYCVPEHVEAIRKHGPCAVHRRTFAPIKTWFPVEQPDAQVAEGDDKPRQKRKSGKKSAPKK